jgi:hypothetical protein
MISVMGLRVIILCNNLQSTSILHWVSLGIFESRGNLCVFMSTWHAAAFP